GMPSLSARKNKMRLERKVAVITGAGSGIGRAIAEMFVEQGAYVVCADISGQQEVARAIGERALPIRADVTCTKDVARMVSFAEERFGRVDILCNNAGIIGPVDAPLHEQDED